MGTASKKAKVIRRTRNKKSNKPYRSAYEARFAQWLESQKIKYEYEKHEVTYLQKVPRCVCQDCQSTDVKKVRTYLPDFYLPDYNMYIETKGRFTSEDRSKMKAVCESNKDLDIRMLFMADNWISTKKKSKYTDWCTSKGILSAVGVKLPKEWLSETD